MKKLIISALLGLLLITTAADATGSAAYYKKLARRRGVGTVREYWAEEITPDLLQSRGNSVLIEKCIGEVTNNKRDGRLLGVEGPYNYISYRGVKGARKGDIILTVLVYNPGAGEDDINTRFDYIMSRAKR